LHSFAFGHSAFPRSKPNTPKIDHHQLSVISFQLQRIVEHLSTKPFTVAWVSVVPSQILQRPKDIPDGNLHTQKTLWQSVELQNSIAPPVERD